MKQAAESIVAADRLKPAAEQKYAGVTVTQDNYFPIVSAERLGTAQSAQFQSGDQQGADWYWGTKCTEEGVCDESNTINQMIQHHRKSEEQCNYDNNENRDGDRFHTLIFYQDFREWQISGAGWGLSLSRIILKTLLLTHLTHLEEK